MKYRLSLLLFMLFTIHAFAQKNTTMQEPYKQQFSRADSLMNQSGLPQSAVKVLQDIYKKAKTADQPVQMLKAQLYLMQATAQYEEGADTGNIRMAVTEAKSAAFPYNAIWHSIAAQLYYSYYQQHQWQILQRTPLHQEGLSSIETWDAPHFFRSITRHYDQSLEDERELKAVALQPFTPVLTGSVATRYLRPTLFDLLAYRAVGYYSREEYGITQPAYQFILNDPAYLSDAAAFVKLSIASRDSTSNQLKALLLYQDILAAHLKDAEPDALIDADLQRLKFVYDHATFSDKKISYSKALADISKRYPDNAAATEASYRMLALQYETPVHPYSKTAEKPEHAPRDLVALRKALLVLAARFPKSEGGINAQQLAKNIATPNLSVQCEEAIIPGEYSKVLMTYKNVPQVWVRVLILKEDDFKKLMQNNQEDGKKILLRSVAVQSFSQSMPAADDYESHTTELPVAPLSKGFYAIMLSGNATFSENDNGLVYALFQASDISFITQQGTASGFVLNRKAGKPLAGAQLDFYTQEWKNSSYTWIKKASAKAQADGSFDANGNNLYTTRTIVHYGNDVFYADAGIYAYGRTPESKASTATFFFTDRSIYRPGQTVFFKGIVVRKEVDVSQTHALAGTKSEVTFKDVNGQMIKTLTLTTNEFGSFTGSFVAPQSGITGQMSISDATGSTYFSVEEYKRPKFEVVFDTLKGSYALNEQITVNGIARAYAGNVIDGATVKYRVVRETYWPYPWLYRRMIMPASAEVEVKQGNVATDEIGRFNVTFTTLPDETIEPALRPFFSYTIYTDVTDASGETHSASEIIKAGYQSVQISATIPEKATPEELEKLSVSITNLNGQPLQQQATITITVLNAPKRMFRNRLWEMPELYVMDEPTFRQHFPLDEYKDESKPDTWETGSIAYQRTFQSSESSMLAIPAGTFRKGWYVISITTKDKSSNTLIEEKKYVQISGGDAYAPINIAINKKTFEPGETAKATVSSGFKDVYIIQQEAGATGKAVTKTIAYNGNSATWIKTLSEANRGGIALQWLMVKDNRVYTEQQFINMPWSNKDLQVTWATHRDKLSPGAKETWTVTIRGSKKEKAATELLAGMYDASLDAFRIHEWSIDGLFPLANNYTSWDKNGGFGIAYNRALTYYITPETDGYSKEYEQLIFQDAQQEVYRSVSGRSRGGVAYDRMAAPAAPMASAKEAMPAGQMEKSLSFKKVPLAEANEARDQKKQEGQSGAPPLRKNLQETAFFFPQLKTDVDGAISFSFTLPEALTEWKFMVLAHTKSMAVGQLTGKVKTQKELMMQPNLPRFFRQGDELTIMTKISNLSDAQLNGTARLEIVDAQTLQPVNLSFRLKEEKFSFSVAKAQSTTAAWTIHIPESRYEPVLIRISAIAGNFSDGEENMIPVLTNRTLVTETLPLWMNGTSTKSFQLNKLLHSDTSKTLAQHRLTVEYTTNPAWYAVQALPYLMEYPYECAEQTFNRYYANALAAHILDKVPRVKAIFEQWKTTDTTALISNLQKNEELKSALLEETPWVMEAKDETAQKHNIALLFDSYKLSISQDAALNKLNDMVLSEGAFPWFKGGGQDRYITQYIATGMARLKHLGITNNKTDALQERMQSFLDQQITNDYNELIRSKAKLDEQQISYLQVQYLYLCSFNNHTAANSKAFNYYKQQAAKYWLRFNNYSKGMIALSLYRMGDKGTAANIIQSLGETAQHSEELGMYWSNGNSGYWWYEAPVESQSLLIECFSEAAQDVKATDELKRWLLKQKQTQNWKTTKATADACYALLLNGTQWLTSEQQVSINLGDQTIKPAKTEAGTGYFRQAFAAQEISPEMGKIKVTVSNDNGKMMFIPSYGAVYWQYFEQLDKITRGATPLTLTKQLFIERNTDRGPVLEEIKDGNTLKVGDRVKVRIVLHADRDMEYLHLKDMRAAAFEPVNVLSGYRWQAGLGYYESTRDACSNFFISYLPKGTYVFEYPVNVMAKGDFSNGISTIQCMYAPEFSSHSEGMRIQVR